MDALTSLWSEAGRAKGTVVCPSGASACTTALMSVLKAGDHLLVTDSVYRPTRIFCDNVLKRYGVETTYYDPAIGGGDCCAVPAQHPRGFHRKSGVADVRDAGRSGHCAGCPAHNAFTLMDNTWATPLYFRPLDHGVDISINAATKYPSGHSDVLAGLIAANERAWPMVRDTHGDLGVYLGPDDIFLLLRGIRTMAADAEQAATALKSRSWLQKRPEVLRCCTPACRMIPAMPCSSAISPVRPACSASC
jgi:cystathionine beta-lyase